MQMFLTQAEHSQFLFDCAAEKPHRILVSSFGIYAGITYSGQDSTEWGEKYRLATRDLLETLRAKGKRHSPRVQLLIGVGEYRSCKGNKYCMDCEMQYAKGLIRLVYHAEKFPEFEWRVSTQLHLKCVIFYYEGRIRGVAGGRNFTDSNWADVTFELLPGQAEVLADHTIRLWDGSPKLDDAAVNGILRDQQISDKTLEAIVNFVEAGLG